MKVNKVLKNPKKILTNLRRTNIGEGLAIVGILGTVGKTNTAHLLFHLLTENGIKSAMISSDGFIAMDEKDLSIKANNLTYGQFVNIVDKLESENYEILVVEASSKILSNGTFDRVKFDAGIITNIKHHDKDLYANWDEYAEWKLSFINSIKDEGLLIVDNSNELLDWLEQNESKVASNILLYMSGAHEFNKISDQDTQEFLLEEYNYKLNSNLDVNIENAIKAIRMAQKYIAKKTDFTKEIETFEFPKGRHELIKNNQINVIIDSAKRKEEIEFSLTKIRQKISDSQKIVAVIGAEGSIDLERKKVGLGAIHVADKIIICPTDPRKEDVSDINNMIIANIEKEGGVVVERFLSEEEFKMTNKDSLKLRLDRVTKNGDVPVVAFDENNYTARLNAIELALILANPGDLVYISGKGNDDTLYFDGVEYEWNDSEALRICFEKLGMQ